MIAWPVFVLKYTLYKMLKSLYSKYSAPLRKAPVLRTSRVQLFCNPVGIGLKEETLEQIYPPGYRTGAGGGWGRRNKHGRQLLRKAKPVMLPPLDKWRN